MTSTIENMLINARLWVTSSLETTSDNAPAPIANE